MHGLRNNNVYIYSAFHLTFNNNNNIINRRLKAISGLVPVEGQLGGIAVKAVRNAPIHAPLQRSCFRYAMAKRGIEAREA